MARISLPATSSPNDLRYSPTAPATQLSNTSLIEQFRARPTAFTSWSGIGWHQATRLLLPGVPLRRVGESSGMSANAAPVSYTHLRAHETGRNRVCRLP